MKKFLIFILIFSLLGVSLVLAEPVSFNDPYYDKLWYLKQIQAEEAWQIQPGGRNEIIVAVLDTGVQIDHPDLKENIWTNVGEISGNGIDDDKNGFIDDVYGWDFVSNVPDPQPKFEGAFTESGIHHGTLIAGIISSVAHNAQGTVGLSYGVRIMPIRVLNNEGVGSVDNVIQGINYALYNGAKIINLSFVGTEKNYFLKEALKKAWEMGVLVVAAAGNETLNTPLDLDKNPVYPVCLDEGEGNFIIGVAATDQNDTRTSFSDYGKNCIDVSAPGTRFYGPLVYNPEKNLNDFYGGYWSGTSLAAPLVSSLAALVWSVNPLLSAENVRDIILSQTDSIDSLNPEYKGKLGRGRINAYQAVSFAFNQGKNLLSSESYTVTGAGPGGGPHVRIFDLAGNPKGGFFAYDKRFAGGITVACGDLDGDGLDEIITAPASGLGPLVRIFDRQGNLKSEFYAFNETYTGGVNVFSKTDLDGNKKDDILVAVRSLASPYVRVFGGEFAALRLQFLPYDRLFYQGVKIAAADLNGNKKSEIVVGLGPGREPYVRIFDSQGSFLTKFLAYHPLFKGGVNVATIKVNK